MKGAVGCRHCKVGTLAHCTRSLSPAPNAEAVGSESCAPGAAHPVLTAGRRDSACFVVLRPRISVDEKQTGLLRDWKEVYMRVGQKYVATFRFVPQDGTAIQVLAERGQGDAEQEFQGTGLQSAGAPRPHAAAAGGGFSDLLLQAAVNSQVPHPFVSKTAAPFAWRKQQTHCVRRVQIAPNPAQ